MNVIESFSSFTGFIDVGYLGFFIKLGNVGTKIEVDNLVGQALHFPSIVLYGDVFNDKNELVAFLRKLTKNNPDIKVFIFCDSKKRPKSLGKYTNIFYNINIPLKKIEEDMDKKINPLAVKFFKESNGRFIFNISNEDDVDEALAIIRIVNLSKMLVYFSPTSGDLIEDVMKWAFSYRVNFAPNFKDFLWDDFGRIKNESEKKEA